MKSSFFQRVSKNLNQLTNAEIELIEYIKENKSNNLIQEKYVYVGPYFCDLYFVPFPDKNWKIGMF